MTNNEFDWGFNTFGDKVLEKMLKSVIDWCITPNSKKSILTLSGPTEIGKTHLLKKVKELYSEYSSNFPKRKQNYPEVVYITWISFTREALNNPNVFDIIKNAGLVLVEDFLSEDLSVKNNYTTIVVSNAYEIINSRVGKPTIIDTNRAVDEFDKIDPRIHSRLFREGGTFLSIPNSTKRYLKRK